MTGHRVACGDFFSYGDPDDEWVVEGFATAALADEYARRFLRASIEAHREPGDDAEATHARWHRYGQYAAGPKVRSDYARWCAANPATRREETDYAALDPRRAP